MNSNELSKELLDVLACPACSSDLNYNKKNSKLICTKCRKEFKIENYAGPIDFSKCSEGLFGASNRTCTATFNLPENIQINMEQNQGVTIISLFNYFVCFFKSFLGQPC